MPTLELKDLHKEYRDGEKCLSIIDKLNFTFPSAGTVAIVGRSGIGKSTLLHVLAGLDKPTSGLVLLEGQNLHEGSPEDRARRRGENIGFIFQFHHLLPEFSAEENVAMPLIIKGQEREQALEQARVLLDRVGLKDRVTHRPSRLSGGEQQRVALARALVSRPRLLLADEPTGNLDTESSHIVQNLLKESIAELNALLIVVTHSKELAQQMDCTLELQKGGALVRC